MRFSKIVYAAAILVCFAVVASASQKQGDGGTGTPQLVIESPTHDFGEVKTGTPLKWIFKIKNTGKADLVINSVSPG